MIEKLFNRVEKMIMVGIAIMIATVAIVGASLIYSAVNTIAITITG